MPTAFPKCSPSEMMGLLVLLNDHKGDEDIARLGDDLDLEIDEILPALDFAELLGLVKVSEGRATLTDPGRKLLAGTIRDRKSLLREQLKRTALFKTLVRALDGAPEHLLTEEEVIRLIDFTTAPADEYVQNIINWGRYTELFRYDANRRVLLPARPASASRSGGSVRPPPSGGATTPPSNAGEAPTRSSGSPSDRVASRALALA